MLHSYVALLRLIVGIECLGYGCEVCQAYTGKVLARRRTMVAMLFLPLVFSARLDPRTNPPYTEAVHRALSGDGHCAGLVRF